MQLFAWTFRAVPKVAFLSAESANCLDKIPNYHPVATNYVEVQNMSN